MVVALSWSRIFRTSRSLDRHDSGADMDFDIVWDDQLLFGKDVLHLEQWCWGR